ncbi:hypothetical protein BCR44DRAFT_1437601 [Catenaria anguillulae PL171]|uniref:Uncharacterized protein n=1 Tax=Catenaria anguillulae PL171 TaxID=765915 RepID=A0A1Y2HGV9_9FUNG|nr:hypothetical protein BCR44DRAFT_1437601 [Catenaria anguillulae PL171]
MEAATTSVTAVTTSLMAATTSLMVMATCGPGWLRHEYNSTIPRSTDATWRRVARCDQ